MPLLEFWESSPKTVDQLSIEQIVVSAGNGVLKDASACSIELRDYLSRIPSEKIASYVEHCLSTSFNKGGMVLQDLVNELGRRLDYKVTNGRYQGTTNTIGFDGIWLSGEGHSIILEVKTTDAYRISLDTIANYRNKLTTSNEIGSNSSILIVVGREDTGELEAQVRGSRHAWDIRLISADALIKLVQIKENTEEIDTGRKIQSLLVPMEYTRLDKMIDVMFTTAKDVEASTSITEKEAEVEEQPADFQQKAKNVWEFTEAESLQNKREQIVSAISKAFGFSLIKKSRALFWSADHSERLACTISKHYLKKSAYPYWYAYHPQWHEFLTQGRKGFLVLGCMDLTFAFAIPAVDMEPLLDALNTTTREDGQVYWHMNISEQSSDNYYLLLPKKSSALNLNKYRINI